MDAMVNILNATDGSTLEINGWLIWYSCGNQPSWKPQVYAKNSAKTYDGTDTPKTETTVHSVSQMLLCLSAATMPSSRPTTGAQQHGLPADAQRCGQPGLQKLRDGRVLADIIGYAQISMEHIRHIIEN